MNIILTPIDQLKPYAHNPKTHPPEQVEKIARSIEEFGFLVPILIDADNSIIAGHGRLMAARKLGLDEIPTIRVDHLTEAQIRAYRIADNRLTESSWDMELLESEIVTLQDMDFDLDLTGFDDIELGELFPELGEMDGGDGSEVASVKLIDKFIIPPFSVFDTRQGYWQERKRAWLGLGIKGEEGRDVQAIANTTNVDYPYFKGRGKDDASIFDPVLCEIAYRWFCPEGGTILDPMAGEITKGAVAEYMGYLYTGIEIRPEQIGANNRNASELNLHPSYILGDANKLDDAVGDTMFDMIFTSPPYYDLEVYSKEDMSAFPSYELFMQRYDDIFKQCYDHLHSNRFLVIKVGEIRNKKTGEYRNFVGDTITSMLKAGFKYYNEFILVNCAGSLPIRVSKSFVNRKCGKMHQNVLVFFKGNPANIQKDFKELEVADHELSDIPT